MDLPNGRVWAVTPMDCIALVVSAEQSTNATRIEIVIVSCQTIIREPNILYSKDAFEEREFVGVTKKTKDEKKVSSV